MAGVMALAGPGRVGARVTTASVPRIQATSRDAKRFGRVSRHHRVASLGVPGTGVTPVVSHRERHREHGRSSFGVATGTKKQHVCAAGTDPKDTEEGTDDAIASGEGDGDPQMSADASPTKSTSLPGGAEVDLDLLFGRFKQVALPFWTENSDSSKDAKWLLAGVVALTLGTTGASVVFNFLGRDFYNAIAEKQPEEFDRLLKTYIAVIAAAIPVFVMRDYYQSVLTLKWRAWMTQSFVTNYLDKRNFYHIQTGSIIDNPDQRIVDDVANFTTTSLGLGFTILNAVIDLISFSGILLGIYKPLVLVLFVYSIGGTVISAKLGQPLVGLNFKQEAREADFRYGLVRVRENAESVAFYQGEAAENAGLKQRLGKAVDNLGNLLIATRNVDFFTSFYRYMVTFLPAAVVAPLYFRGEIEFGVINQSSSAFSHILGDVSLVVYQVERLASFSAVTDRLGQMTEVLEKPASKFFLTSEDASASEKANDATRMAGLITRGPIGGGDIKTAVAQAFVSAAKGLSLGVPGQGVRNTETGTPVTHTEDSSVRLALRNVTVRAPGRAAFSKPALVENLNLTLRAGKSVLVMGPSGAGKTSLLRAVAGLWEQGKGEVRWKSVEPLDDVEADAVEIEGAADDATKNSVSVSAAAPNASTENSGLYFLPQRPYLVLGTLRQQLLYPTWVKSFDGGDNGHDARSTQVDDFTKDDGEYKCGVVGCPLKPSDAVLKQTLEKVNLGYLLTRSGETKTLGGLDATGDWSSILSLGEQQRLAFARVLLAQPPVAILDEATSALDGANEKRMYALLKELPDTSFISVGHRVSLLSYHDEVLRLEGDTTWRVLETGRYKEEIATMEV